MALIKPLQVAHFLWSSKNSIGLLNPLAVHGCSQRALNGLWRNKLSRLRMIWILHYPPPPVKKRDRRQTGMGRQFNEGGWGRSLIIWQQECRDNIPLVLGGRGFKLLWLESTSSCNSLIGYSLKRHGSSLVRLKFLRQKSVFTHQFVKESPLRLRAQVLYKSFDSLLLNRCAGGRGLIERVKQVVHAYLIKFGAFNYHGPLNDMKKNYRISTT